MQDVTEWHVNLRIDERLYTYCIVTVKTRVRENQADDDETKTNATLSVKSSNAIRNQDRNR